MAGFYIPIDSGSWNKTEVFRTAELLSITMGEAFVAYLEFWDYVRRNSTDGFVKNMTPAIVDHIVRIPGFCAAASSAHVEWIIVREDGIEQPRFANHTHGAATEKEMKHRDRAAKSRLKAALAKAHGERTKSAHKENKMKLNKTKPTERNGTKHDRTEPEPEPESQPCRAVVLENSETPVARPVPGREPETAPKPASEATPSNRPASEPLFERAKRDATLAALQNEPIEIPTGVHMHGSVFAPSVLKPQNVAESPPEFWIEWYRKQLAATSPAFRGANKAELAFVLAAVAAVKQCSEASLKKCPRIARLNHWLKNRETNAISDANFATAYRQLAEHFGTDLTEKIPEILAPKSQPQNPNEKTSHHKPRGIGLKEELKLRRLKSAELAKS